jgi:hypothetical protein
VILTQNKPKANSKPRAIKKPKAIFRSKAIMLSTIQRPRAINLNSNAKKIDPKQDLQITNSLNKQQGINLNKLALRLKRTLKPTFKV